MQIHHHDRAFKSLPPHLGGHLNKTHVDIGAFNYLMRVYKPTSFLDVGCGPGGMVYLAAIRGLYAVGIDGDFTLPQFQAGVVHPDHVKFCLHDFTEGARTTGDLRPVIDIVWSVEFLEHVNECHLPAVLHTMKMGKVIVITAAPPGWPGHHHVNCRSEEYWQGVFAAMGYTYDGIATQEIRHHSTMEKPFMQNTGMVFVKDKGRA